MVRHPDVAAARGDGVGIVEPVARAAVDLGQGAGRGRELGDRVAILIRHPDVVAVRCDGNGVVEPPTEHFDA